jgi:hypothetical protein
MITYYTNSLNVKIPCTVLAVGVSKTLIILKGKVCLYVENDKLLYIND